MALNTAQADSIDARREAVARHRLRGLSQREIVAQLAADGWTNPETGEPYSLGTVNSDVQALTRQWRGDAAKATATLKGQILAELREVRRAGWAGAGNPAVTAALLKALEDDDASVKAAAARALGTVGLPDLTNILRSLKQESELLGADELPPPAAGVGLPPIREIVVNLVHAGPVPD
jgi:hypothetical protein